LSVWNDFTKGAPEITAIEAHGDYTRILLNEGKNLMMKQTLSLWESQLPAGLFVKVSRSLVVNTHSVAKLVRKNLLTWELQFEGARGYSIRGKRF